METSVGLFRPFVLALFVRTSASRKRNGNSTRNVTTTQNTKRNGKATRNVTATHNTKRIYTKRNTTNTPSKTHTHPDT